MSKKADVSEIKAEIAKISEAITGTAIPSLMAALNSVQLAKVVLESAIADRNRLLVTLEDLESEANDL